MCKKGIHYFKSEKAAKSYLNRVNLIGKNYNFDNETGDKEKMHEYDENRKLIRIRKYYDQRSCDQRRYGLEESKVICELDLITRVYRKFIDDDLVVMGEVDDDLTPILEWKILTDKKSYEIVVPDHEKVKEHYVKLY